MNRLLGCLTIGTVGAMLSGCGQPSAPTAAAPAAPSGVVAVPSVPQKMVLEKAGKGSGKQGRLLDEHEGIYVTPIKALFSTKEFIAYEIQVKHALNLYEAYEGRAPKDHDEFMEKIIKANMIELPVLPEGHKYVYDPMLKTLMVEKPAP